MSFSGRMIGLKSGGQPQSLRPADEGWRVKLDASFINAETR